ncbi:uncharacterized protein AMSG_05785 [Thecamonas trahens ATCC 50062]|uniref:RING-type domain-containing protein n=1 Tax=Thecamonas trahens ATCC 50062 TaxID=461836 RepID=A0A0L0DCG6_THETB|nr:hypothetical protein AMSG_05785 [Thecamonas trahens ATCC 50062]KNC50027.1 hypothetical protein AMSG_05785 [Thecamonas trahens ATCC 50062]|eukprot:XP_013757194.1 hypothetical protein AMSG_05785 [Thecamonas trahens ATCC 50062]
MLSGLAFQEQDLDCFGIGSFEETFITEEDLERARRKHAENTAAPTLDELVASLGRFATAAGGGGDGGVVVLVPAPVVLCLDGTPIGLAGEVRLEAGERLVWDGVRVARADVDESAEGEDENAQAEANSEAAGAPPPSSDGLSRSRGSSKEAQPLAFCFPLAQVGDVRVKDVEQVDASAWRALHVTVAGAQHVQFVVPSSGPGAVARSVLDAAQTTVLAAQPEVEPVAEPQSQQEATSPQATAGQAFSLSITTLSSASGKGSKIIEKQNGLLAKSRKLLGEKHATAVARAEAVRDAAIAAAHAAYAAAVERAEESTEAQWEAEVAKATKLVRVFARDAEVSVTQPPGAESAERAERAEEEGSDGLPECAICYTSRVDTVLLPCRHEMCGECVARLPQPLTCPWDRASVVATEPRT